MKIYKNLSLPELLVIIGIIVVFMGIVYVAVDPPRRVIEARNTQRWEAANSIINAYMTYIFDNQGREPLILDTAVYQLGEFGLASTSACAHGPEGLPTTTVGFVSLGDSLLGKYISAIPFDPATATSSSKTKFYIQRNNLSRITVGACDSEAIAGSVAPSISVQR